jgi:uncharacterized protein YidB (DUF937 family)
MSDTNVPAAIMQLINDHGGIQGIYDSFQKGGMNDVIQSWIGTGANQQVSSDSLSGVLDQSVVEQTAKRNGMDADQLMALAAQYLPMIVDNLTPQEKIPDESEGFLNMVINFFRREGQS